MIRWLVVVFLALIVFSAFGPWLEKMGFGKLPGDFRFRFLGRSWFLPFGSSVAIGLIGMLIGKFV